ncbi:hypothetical protein MXB_335 [Myxobolus squamalis]|nr:hypothetical protein MXB_335 [Myxobolus squamalis]
MNVGHWTEIVRIGVCKISSQLLEDHFKPLFNVISDESTDANTFVAGLRSLYMLIFYGVIAESSIPCFSNVISCIANAINGSKYTSQASNIDELILFEIIEIFKILVSRNLCVHLTDEQLCACLQICFGVYFEHKLTEVLRRSAEIALIAFLTYLVKGSDYSLPPSPGLLKHIDAPELKIRKFGLPTLHEYLRFIISLSTIIISSLIEIFNKMSDRISTEKREFLRDFLIDLLDDHLFLTELYLNYDIQINFSLSSRALEGLISFIKALEESEYNLSSNNTFLYEIKRKKIYDRGIPIINSSLSTGIDYYCKYLFFSLEDYEPILAEMFRFDMRIDRKTVGESIGNRKYSKLLKCYVESFYATGIRIDEALRDFLESFRIPGESPVISNILENFSQHYFNANSDDFKTVDSVFTLCYAIIMLNVDQHNTSAKQQKSMVVDDFINNLKGVNGGEDFGQDLLKQIFESIRKNEFVVSIEQPNPVKKNYLWRLASLKSQKLTQNYHTIEFMVMQKNIFRNICHITINTLCTLMQRTITGYALNLVVDGYRNITKLAAKFQYNQTVDKLVIQLLKFSKMLRSVIENVHLDTETIVMDLAIDSVAQSCLIESFNIIANHADCLTLSWIYILAVISNLCAAELLPISMYEFEDFVDPSARFFLPVGKRLDKRKIAEPSSGFINSFVQMIITNTDSDEAIINDEAYKTAQTAVCQCKIEDIFNYFKKLSTESFVELSKSLIKFASFNPPKIPFDMDSSDSQCVTFLTSVSVSTFFFETLMTFCLSNKNRIHLILPEVTKLIYNITDKNNQISVLGFRATEGAIRLCNRLIDVDENVSKAIMLSLRSLLCNPALILKYSISVVFGICELLKSRLMFIQSCWDWVCILEILEISGCGRNSLLTSVSIYPEIVDQCQVENPNAGETSRLSDLHMSEIYQQKALYDAIDDGEKDDLFKFKTSFSEFEFLSFSKSIQCLVYLINNRPSNLVHLNILPCVHALTTFSERIFYTSQYLNSCTTNNNNTFMNRDCVKGFDSKQLEIHTNIILELLFGLFCFSSCILINYITSLDEEILSEHERSSFLWYSCWSHLLKRMVIFLIDHRRHVRLSAMQFIERSLRINDIQFLPINEWSICFQRILFPMLKLLISHPPPVSLPEIDETKSRAFALVMRLFLHNVSELAQHNSFSNLWQTMLECFLMFKSSKSTDILQEALPEYLKNMLSVMYTSGIIDIFDNTPQSIWNITQQSIQSVFPEFSFPFLDTVAINQVNIDLSSSYDSSKLNPTNSDTNIIINNDLPKTTLAISLYFL